MGIEGGSFDGSTDLSEYDTSVRDMLGTPEGSEKLYNTDQVLWIRGAIGLDTGRGVSQILDEELAWRFIEYGFAEWDPKAAQAVRQYLRGQGYIG